jgi:SAM-dependent methyltransferase
VNGSLRRGLEAVRGAARRAWLPEAGSAAEHWQRIVLNEAVRRHIESLDPPTRTAVEISGDLQAQHAWKAFTSLSYPEFDLCAPLESGQRYDVVICEQVLEHVVDPLKAAANLRRLCASGGHVIVSTPFMVRVHELPLYGLADYWRFTPRGLRTLLEHGGLSVSHVGAWGNRSCIMGNFDRWPARRRWHSLRNEPNLPVQVWAFARNPA